MSNKNFSITKTKIFLFLLPFLTTCTSLKIRKVAPPPRRILYDDFYSASIDTKKWRVINKEGTINISNGILTLKNGENYRNIVAIVSKDSVFPPAKIVFKIRTSSSYSLYKYYPQAGFTDMKFCYSNYIRSPKNFLKLSHNGIINPWRTDSIVLKKNSVSYYVEDKLIYREESEFYKAQRAYFSISCNQRNGCKTYELQIDWIRMIGSSVPPEIPKKTRSRRK